jgi:hypothetical protein
MSVVCRPGKRGLAAVAAAMLAVIATAGGCDSTANYPGTDVSPLVAGTFRTYGAWPVDIDGDGDDDLLVNNHGRAGSALYLNDGQGRLTPRSDLFEPYPARRPVLLDRHDCDVADVDRNGRMDIYCTAGAKQGTVTKEFPAQTNELLLQQPDGSFVNRSDIWGVSEPTHRGRDVAFVNLDGDGYPDLVTTADRRTDGLRSETVVYRNDRGTRFVDRGSAGLLRFGPTRCLERADWNRDGFTDLALCPYDGGVRLYEATGTMQFRDVTTARGAGSMATRTWDVAFGDVDRDGWLDLVRADTSSVTVRPWDPSGSRFVDGQSIAEPDAQDVALGRFDGDARIDLYVMNRGCETCTPRNPTDRIYLGRAGGRFALAGPVDATGVGDFVAAWPAMGNGLVRWVVGNGWGPVSGPLDIVALRPTTTTTTTTSSTTTTTTSSTTTTTVG